MKREAYSISVKELAELGPDKVPDELLSAKHLIYNSPAALAFNSPGAEGYGVKRAALCIPGSVMLLIGPDCCGRNTSFLNDPEGYGSRFFYYSMDETDIVTGRHLKQIPQAVSEILDTLPERPSVVILCVTCVDALLGTDLERVCRKAAEACQIPVVPCYMYALTREGRKPPMVDVRCTIYSLLEKQERDSRTVNILGYFAPLRPTSELYEILHQLGLRQINEVSRCRTFEEYKAMSRANFNLLLYPDVRLAARNMEEKLGIPSIELTRLYQVDKIHNQYLALAKVLGGTVDDRQWLEETRSLVQQTRSRFAGIRVAIGETVNGSPFELALALTRFGFRVVSLFATPTEDQYPWLHALAALSPDTRVYSNLSPTMLYYRNEEQPVDVTLGRDAAYYYPDSAHVHWNEDVQPFGYDGVLALLRALTDALERRPEP